VRSGEVDPCEVDPAGGAMASRHLPPPAPAPVVCASWSTIVHLPDATTASPVSSSLPPVDLSIDLLPSMDLAGTTVETADGTCRITCTRTV
jgi:hypothetical protein